MKEKRKVRILTHEEVKILADMMEPLKIPKLKRRVKKTCNNCADYIVCWAAETLKDDEQAEKCKNWHLDYFEYEKLCEEEMGKEGKE